LEFQVLTLKRLEVEFKTNERMKRWQAHTYAISSAMTVLFESRGACGMKWIFSKNAGPRSRASAFPL
jgi:hypothetical protein